MIIPISVNEEPVWRKKYETDLRTELDQLKTLNPVPKTVIDVVESYLYSAMLLDTFKEIPVTP